MLRTSNHTLTSDYTLCSEQVTTTSDLLYASDYTLCSEQVTTG